MLRNSLLVTAEPWTTWHSSRRQSRLTTLPPPVAVVGRSSEPYTLVTRPRACGGAAKVYGMARSIHVLHKARDHTMLPPALPHLAASLPR